jgi:hypothetical protein
VTYLVFGKSLVALFFVEIRSSFLGASCQKRDLSFWLQGGEVTGGTESGVLVFQREGKYEGRESRAWGPGRETRAEKKTGALVLVSQIEVLLTAYN